MGGLDHGSPTVDVEVAGTRRATKGQLRQEVAGDWRAWEACPVPCRAKWGV